MPKYEVKHSVMGVFQSMDTFDLPPHTVTKHHAFIPLAKATRILSYQPHMHVRGKSMSMEAIYPNGRVQMLSHVENFNFNWHVNYVYTGRRGAAAAGGDDDQDHGVARQHGRQPGQS